MSESVSHVDWEARAREAERRAVDAQNDVWRAQQEFERREAELHSELESLREKAAAFDGVVNSVTWKTTAPVRDAKRIVTKALRYAAR